MVWPEPKAAAVARPLPVRVSSVGRRWFCHGRLLTIFFCRRSLLWRPWLRPSFQNAGKRKINVGWVRCLMSPLPFPRDMAGGDAAVPRGEQSFGVLALLPGGCCSLRNPFCRTSSWCVLGCPKSWFLGVLLMGDSSPSVPSVIWQHRLKQDLSLCLGLCLEKSCLTPWGAVTSVLSTPTRVQVFLGCSRAGTGLESHAGSPSAGQWGSAGL